jgi:TonB family protein
MVIADSPCSIPDKDVTIAQAATPAYPASAADLGIGPVVVYVQVTVNPDGSLAHAVIARSSNNSAIDSAALRAARQSLYSPRIVNCSAIETSQTLAVYLNPYRYGDPSKIVPIPPGPVASPLP